MWRKIKQFRMRRDFRRRLPTGLHGRKVVYALTPTPDLKNIGDHAQVVAIEQWLDQFLPGLPRVEVDKNETTVYLDLLQSWVSDEDLIFLHSGGNLGDRGIWSETARRAIIQGFPNNRIISLPQTIFFSDTEKGQEEKENSRRIYARHDQLTVMARDRVSGELADELFPSATVHTAPDFVLSLPVVAESARPAEPQVLFLLRRDTESRFSEKERDELTGVVSYSTTSWDTTLDEPIERTQRREELDAALARLRASSVVVTDRFHGLIFAVLTRTPCVVLPTTDHKLSSAIDWFADVPYVFYCPDPAEIPAHVEEALQCSERETPNWNELYFHPLAEKLGLPEIGRHHEESEPGPV